MIDEITFLNIRFHILIHVEYLLSLPENMLKSECNKQKQVFLSIFFVFSRIFFQGCLANTLKNLYL